MAQPIPPVETLIPLTETGQLGAAPQFSEYDRLLLEATTIEETWQSYADGQPLLHQVQRLDLPHGTHRRLYSEPPTAATPPMRIVTILGHTESIDSPIIRKTHTYLSGFHPDIPVSTEATYGVDGTADDRSAWQKLGIGLDQIGRRMFENMKCTYADAPIIVTATSQGASVLARIREYNDHEDCPLQFLDQILYEPYLLTRQEKAWGRLGKFCGHVVIDNFRELFTRTKPAEIPTVWWDELHSRPHAQDYPALIGQELSLIHRTEKARIAAMLAHGAVVLQGTKDCLGCQETNTLPGVELVTVAGKGHSMGINPLKRARALSNAITRRAA